MYQIEEREVKTDLAPCKCFVESIISMKKAPFPGLYKSVAPRDDLLCELFQYQEEGVIWAGNREGTAEGGANQ
jgi:hypothetical protein